MNLCKVYKYEKPKILYLVFKEISKRISHTSSYILQHSHAQLRPKKFHSCLMSRYTVFFNCEVSFLPHVPVQTLSFLIVFLHIISKIKIPCFGWNLNLRSTGWKPAFEPLGHQAPHLVCETFNVMHIIKCAHLRTIALNGQ